MKNNTEIINPLYSIYLYDYACPGFITAYKSFYGSAQEIEYYLSQQSKNMSKIIDEIVKFEVLVHGSQEYLALNYEWAHKNAWGYWYHFRCKKLRTQHYWISYNCFYKRIVSVWVEDLQFKSPRDKNFDWMEIDMHWGLPGMIVDGHNQLMVEEKDFSAYEEMKEDMLQFQTNPIPVLSGFCDEILGDG